MTNDPRKLIAELAADNFALETKCRNLKMRLDWDQRQATALETALKSIANNSCCEGCREAKMLAASVLAFKNAVETGQIVQREYNLALAKVLG